MFKIFSFFCVSKNKEIFQDFENVNFICFHGELLRKEIISLRFITTKHEFSYSLFFITNKGNNHYLIT